MAGFLDTILAPFRRGATAGIEKAAPVAVPAPTKTIGVAGVQVIGGYIVEDEKNSDLVGRQRYKTFSELLANISIIAAGVRYFLNLATSSEWTLEAAEDDEDGKFRDMAQAALFDDPETPWHRVVRRACMYRFYGFSLQEWTAKRHDDGHLTFADIAPRAQRTIERWDVRPDGAVLGAFQVDPQTNKELYLPRKKLLYVVDDSLNDSPEGLGLFRHVVESSKRLRRYQQLEGWGFEMDLRGIPLGRGPFTELARMVNDGQITAEDRRKIEAPLRDFITNRIKNPELGIVLDSQPFTSTDDATRPSSIRQWDLELLSAVVGTQKEVAAAINRVNHEIAVVLGVENLLVGSTGEGSLALSKDKSQNFFLTVDGALKEVRASAAKDLILRLWELNGWPKNMMPKPKNESVRFKDVEQITAALTDMATAGAILDPEDPAIGEVRDLLGLSRPNRVISMADTGEDGDNAAGGEAGAGGGSPKDPKMIAAERRRRQLRPEHGALPGR